MIQKTVYFRTQEDLDKFNALKNKAEWLHEHLNGAVIAKDSQLHNELLTDGYKELHSSLAEPTTEPFPDIP